MLGCSSLYQLLAPKVYLRELLHPLWDRQMFQLHLMGLAMTDVCFSASDIFLDLFRLLVRMKTFGMKCKNRRRLKFLFQHHLWVLCL